MARITPIDVIRGIHGKYGSSSSDYFATNTSSNAIRLAKYLNKPTGPATEAQLTQMEKFGKRQKLASAWLRANRPSEKNGKDGTLLYQMAQTLKKRAHLSNVRSIVIKYMDAQGNVLLPDPNNPGGTPSTGPDPTPGGSGGGTKPGGSNPGGGGNVSGDGDHE